MKTAALLCIISLIPPSLAASTADWQSRSIYQVLTDRFAKTTDVGGPCNTEDRRYCGGTWRGIVNHLDYIKNMGFDAVWISPVIENIGGNTPYGEAYHGYWTLGINRLNSHFGTPNDLKALSDALHAKGMCLMVDVVVNHIAATSMPPALTYDGYAPFSQPADYHPFCLIRDYNNQAEVERCSLGDEKVVLADLNTELIDTVKHVQKDFFPAFCQAAGVFTLGEVYDTGWDYTGDYTNYMDAVFNYPEWAAILRTFQNSNADTIHAVNAVKLSSQKFKNNGLTSTSSFSENHDNPRLPSHISDPVQVKNIITWTFVGDGIPTLYSGQEAGYTGSADPANREALWFTAYLEDVVLYRYITRLNAARKVAISSRFFSTPFLSTPRKLCRQMSRTSLSLRGLCLACSPMLVKERVERTPFRIVVSGLARFYLMLLARTVTPSRLRSTDPCISLMSMETQRSTFLAQLSHRLACVAYRRWLPRVPLPLRC